MTFGIWEWVRLISYAVSLPAAFYLSMRMARRGDAPLSMLLAVLACLFGWYLVDLTMVSVGMSSRETRNLATPLTVVVAGNLSAMTLSELRKHAMERRIRELGAKLDGNGDTGNMNHAHSH